MMICSFPVTNPADLTQAYETGQQKYSGDTGSQEKGCLGFSGIHKILFSVDSGQFRVRANSMSASTVHPMT